MSNDPKVSIIIPVYGVEKYIVKCIESIKSQSFKDFEAILINDGTKDHSIEIAKDRIAGDHRFIILNKENGGQGSARNLGLDNAKGDYIAFIDSDDYIEPDYLRLMYEKITLENADICTCNVRYVDMKGDTVRLFTNRPSEYRKNNDYLMVAWYISNFMWDKLFHRDIFNNFRFDTSLRTNEDVYILFELIYGKNITSVSEYLYNYVQRPHATSKGAPPSLINDRLKIIEKKLSFSIEKFGHKNHEEYLNYAYLKHFIFVTAVILANYSNHYVDDVNYLKSTIVFNKFRFFDIAKLFLKDKKTAISLFVFKVSPFLFWLLVRFWFRNKVA